MSPETASELRLWSLGRWCGLILLIFGLQLGLIFWLSDHTPVRPRAEVSVPMLQPAGALAPEFLALSDPTWFTLPHAEGVAGRTWLKVPQPEPHFFNWTSPPAWLLFPQEHPDAAFYAFVRSNDFGAAVSAATPEVELTLPEPAPVPLARQRSELRLEGALAQRPLLTSVQLDSKRSTDLLTNSVVQTVVDAKGWPQSVALLKGSGSAAADQEALRRAAVLRFAPLPGAAEQGKASPALLTQGLLIFAWHTVPEPSTNTAESASP